MARSGKRRRGRRQACQRWLTGGTVPISASIILTAFVLAFSHSTFSSSFASYIRNGCSLLYNTATTWLMIKTGLYMLSRSMAVKANKLRDREMKLTGGMKANVMRETNNLEKMRAASTMRRIADRKNTDVATPNPNAATAAGTATGTTTPRVMSPYIGSPMRSPFPGRRGGGPAAAGAGAGAGDGLEDVELGHRKTTSSKTANSQVYLMPER
jgi:hypothetical protein